MLFACLQRRCWVTRKPSRCFNTVLLPFEFVSIDVNTAKSFNVLLYILAKAVAMSGPLCFAPMALSRRC